MAAQRRARIVLRANKNRIVHFLVILRAIYTGMKNHPQFFSNPPVDLATFLAQIDALAGAQQAMKGAPAGASVARNQARDDAYASAESLRAYVQSLCAASPAQAATLAQASAMQIAAVSSHDKPVLGVKKGAIAGSVILSANAKVLIQKGGGRVFNWAYSLDSGKSWIALPPTYKTKTTVSGLPTLTMVRFRVAVSDSAGVMGDWSQEVAFPVV